VRSRYRNTLHVASPIVPIPAPIALTNPNTLTPKMVHQMILSAFSAFGLSGNHKFSSKPWYLDSRASNHMTNLLFLFSMLKIMRAV